MAYTVPTGVPASFPAGTTLTFEYPEHSDFPVADGWTYTFYLAGYLGASDAATGADGVYTFSIAASATANILPGPYTWEIRASSGLEVYPVASGRLDVTRNTAALTATDARAWTEKMLAAVESLLYGGGTIPEVESYQIHGRQLVKMSRKDLLALRNQLKSELSTVTNGGKKPPIRVRFGWAR